MRQSFESSGFVGPACQYVLLDNSSGNTHEPFAALSQQLGAAARERQRYVILCHQDLQADRGVGAADLMARLADLNRLDPGWAVAGNAGFAWDRADYVGKVTDPMGTWPDGRLPARVISLDENFLVVRPDAGVRFSRTLSGFHFYATDLCLQAQRFGRTCYAIDFHLTHLSSGSPDTPEFTEAKRRFEAAWSPAFRLALVPTPSTVLQLSRYRAGRRLLRLGRVREWMVAHNCLRWPNRPTGGPPPWT